MDVVLVEVAVRRDGKRHPAGGYLRGADREAALAELDRISRTLSEISTWLGLVDLDKPAIELECAVRDVDAASWALAKPVRLRPEGWLTRQLPPPYPG